MNSRRFPFKAVAIVSSVVLVAGYVLFVSAGGLLPGSKSARVARFHEDADEPAAPIYRETAPPPPTDVRMMSSSKSGIAISPKDMRFGDLQALTLAAPATQPSR
ncbi:MAG: hypothetical protein ACREJC_07720 [Tepidisphaeraceae bacterium]